MIELYDHLEYVFMDVVHLASVNKSLRNSLIDIVSRKFLLPKERAHCVLLAYHNSIWCFAKERKKVFSALQSLKERGECEPWSLEYLSKPITEHPTQAWWASVFYYASGEPQRLASEFSFGGEWKFIVEFNDYDEFYGTFNVSRSSIPWFKKENIVEIVLAGTKNGNYATDCNCESTLEERQKGNNFEFHEKNCEYGFPIQDFILRMKDCRYVRIYSRGRSPRHFNCGAAWCSPILNSVLNANTVQSYLDL